MTSIRPLFYLFVRQILNGIKRAVSTPRRLISVLVGLGYYFAFLVRPWDNKSAVRFDNVLPSNFKLEPSYIEKGSFLVFILLSIFLSLGIFSFKNTFKPADVDVLFPTPVSNRAVMGFRLVRDYLTTLLFPLILLIFTYKPTMGFVNAVKQRDPNSIAPLFQGAVLAWILLAFAWISISYALSFIVAKYEKKSQLIVQTIGWLVFFASLGVVGYVAVRMNQNPSWQTMDETLSTGWIRVIMILPLAASWLVSGIFTGSAMSVALGLVILLAVIGGGLTVAANLSDWMYDQAATRGFQTQALRDFQRRNDYSALTAERARQGKVKRGRLSNKIALWTFRGGWTLIYKEVLIQSRIGFWLSFFFVILITGISTMFLTMADMGPMSNVGPLLYLGMTGFMAINMSSIQAMSGFVETLRRVEVMKPLPLTSGQIAFFETASKAVVAMVMASVPFLVGFIYKPKYWDFHLAGLLASPFAALALVSAIFLVVVLFPDFDDPTQRSFRGMMQLLALLLVLAPTMAIFGVLLYMKVSPLIPAVITAVINFGLTILITSIAGRFYADFNPSE